MTHKLNSLFLLLSQCKKRLSLVLFNPLAGLPVPNFNNTYDETML